MSMLIGLHDESTLMTVERHLIRRVNLSPRNAGADLIYTTCNEVGSAVHTLE